MDLRCFIAVELPGDLTSRIGAVIDLLSQTGADMKWVKKENLHITLKFLGSTPEASINEIIGALQKKLSHYAPFYIRISGVGSFPPGRHPRVVWIGMDASGQLAAVHKEIDEVMSRYGFKAEERRFSPHLTIGRVRSSRGLTGLITALHEMEPKAFGDVEVRGVALMKSELKPAGPEYERLAEIQFLRRDDVG
ncbi:MAG: RNA 2',3'-cyclic phosphodiesterase [Nitrospirae bacterium]|nr:MAG: RNA 2',3'-cyclic phosphodiesterase [Nitrospirota bacterium]